MLSDLKDALAPTDGKQQPEPSAQIKAVAKDISSMHKQLQPMLTRQQLHTVFSQAPPYNRKVPRAQGHDHNRKVLRRTRAGSSQILDAFDTGLLEAYGAVDVKAIYSRQCVVQVTRRYISCPLHRCDSAQSKPHRVTSASQDVHYLRTEVSKLHLSLPQGYCPKLVQFAKGLSMA